MVDLSDRLRTINGMVDAGKYFTINRARQYGKTTVLLALSDYLKNDYTVFSLDFQTISYADFETEQRFVAAFSREILDYREWIPENVKEKLEFYSQGSDPEITLSVLFKTLLELEKKIVLIIDEVDTASNNQVFLIFLAQLRAYYLKRRRMRAFQSVILAGVYDIRNIRRRIRPEERHKQNSPWNIAADFDVNMSFSPKDIAGMPTQYEADQKTGMDIPQIAGILYEYTSGYPVLVSRLCKLMDEKLSGMICRLLFQGQTITYNADDDPTDLLLMFGFIKVENATVQIANRILETRLYNYFLTLPESQNGDMYRTALYDKNQFVHDETDHKGCG